MGKKVIPGRRKKYNLLFMTLPFMIIVLLFNYVPIFGWIYSVFDYIPGVSVFDCDFVGLDYFRLIFKDANVVRTLKNTFIFAVIGIVLTPLPMFFAILLNEIKCGPVRRVVQTFTTLPNFISWVLVYSMAFSLFSTSGMMNTFLQQLGILSKPVQFLQDNTHTWLSMWLWGQWKGLGWGAIMYLAAISGIDQELYEAARVDGAGRFRLIWHITVPSLLPTFFVLLIMNVANFLNNGMDQYFVFQNAFNTSKIQVLDLYVYNLGIKAGNYSLATAISMLKSIVSVTLLFTVNGISKVLRGESIV